MKIRSISDTITNSSNEAFITRTAPTGYEYASYDELTWERILEGGNYGIDRDMMIMLLEDYVLERALTDNPFPRTPSQDKPWEQAYYCGWLEDDLNDLWRIFVKAHESEFKELVGYCYVSGPYDHDYYDYDEWEADTDALRDIAVICLGR